MNETLMSKATNGDSNLRNSLINHVGAGSKLHVLLGASPIIFSTSLAVTGAHASMLCEAVVGMSCFVVMDVDWRTEQGLKWGRVARVGEPAPFDLPGL